MTMMIMMIDNKMTLDSKCWRFFLQYSSTYNQPMYVQWSIIMMWWWYTNHSKFTFKKHYTNISNDDYVKDNFKFMMINTHFCHIPSYLLLPLNGTFFSKFFFVACFFCCQKFRSQMVIKLMRKLILLMARLRWRIFFLNLFVCLLRISNLSQFDFFFFPWTENHWLYWIWNRNQNKQEKMTETKHFFYSRNMCVFTFDTCQNWMDWQTNYWKKRRKSWLYR